MRRSSLLRICMPGFAGIVMVVLLTVPCPACADEAVTFLRNAPRLDPNGSDLPPPIVPGPDAVTAVNDDKRAQSLSGLTGHVSRVVSSALGMIGLRYRWGGNTPDSGLDCSGFVRYVFHDALNLTLPRRAADMSRIGDIVRTGDLKPGDLVFFNALRRTVSHVGIYIGDNQFVHSPSAGNTIRVDNLDDSYWKQRFAGARRIMTSYDDTQDPHQRADTPGNGNN